MTLSIGYPDTMENNATAPTKALQITPVSHPEAGRLAQTEYERVLALLESLGGDDWSQSTYCTEWDVWDMTAHLAGAAAGSTSFAEFRRQNLTHPYTRQFENPVDGTNKLQIEERTGRSPAELVTEFRRAGQQAVINRQKLPWLVRSIPLPVEGLSSVGYLMDVIYPRDQWMHRYDICAATGRKLIMTPEHDGRMMALVMLDLARNLKKQIAGRTILVELGGPAGGRFLFGEGPEADCTIRMDTGDFNLLASGRITPDTAVQKADITGNQDVARWFLEHAVVLY